MACVSPLSGFCLFMLNSSIVHRESYVSFGYNIVPQHFCIIPRAHHNKRLFIPSPISPIPLPTSELVTVSLFSAVTNLCLGLFLFCSSLLFVCLFLTFNIWVKSDGTCLSRTISVSIVLSSTIHVLAVVLHLFLLANGIPLCGHTTFYLFILQLIDIWVVSALWRRGRTLLGTFTSKYLCRHMFPFLLGIYSRLELLCHAGALFYTFEKWPNFFLKQLDFLTFPSRMYEGSGISMSWPKPVILCLFNF